MSGLLVSVRNLEEAKQAWRSGVDIIDVKEPAFGALGAVAVDELRRIVGWMHGRPTPISATVGDLPSDASLVAPVVAILSATGLTYVKVGLQEPNKYAELLGGLRSCTRAGTRIILVLFVDKTHDVIPIVEYAKECGCVGVMLDTADKTAGPLRTWCSDAMLAATAAYAQGLGLLFGLAGSLRVEDIDALLPLGADYLGFRGAVCQQAVRTEQLDVMRLLSVRERIPRSRDSTQVDKGYALGG